MLVVILIGMIKCIINNNMYSTSYSPIAINEKIEFISFEFHVANSNEYYTSKS